MPNAILFGIVCVIALGSLAQWLAWRFRVPSILLLLVFGFVAGPVTGPDLLLDPGALREADWVFAFTSLSIGVILFEGGLTLRLRELREVGHAALYLITLGVLLTWAMAGAAAYYLLGFPPGLAVLTGAILTVTGPTVVVPLLRHVRPAGRVGALAKWEGITIDPVGAILAVLVLETLLFINEPGAHGGEYGAALHTAKGVLRTLFISVGVSITGALILIDLIRRRLMPDFLVNPIALTVVIGAFSISNLLQHESGLLTTTLIGIFLANQSYASMRRIEEFKEDLQVLLIAALFIVLSARLEMSALQYIDGQALLFLGALIVLVRPISVFLSLMGTNLGVKEKAFLAWLAPRGIVAAAVASLFSFQLEGLYPEAAVSGLVPIIFLVIVGTVAVYGLTIAPLGRWLGLAQPNPQGVLFVGAHGWARRMARALVEQDVTVLMVDANPKTVWQARREGLPAQQANVLSEGVMERLELSGIGKLVALTPNDEVNSLAALHFSEIFESAEVLQLATRTEVQRDEEGDLPSHLRGRSLFGAGVTYSSLTECFEQKAQVRSLEVKEGFSYESFKEQHGEQTTPLFLIKKSGSVLVFSEDAPSTPQPGDTLVVMADPETDETDLHLSPDAEPVTEEVARFTEGASSEQAMHEFVAQAPLIDVAEPTSFEEAVERVSERLAPTVNASPDDLAQRFMENARRSTTPHLHGAAIPHCRLSGISESVLALVRCREGVQLPVEGEQRGDGAPPQHTEEPVYALLFLVSPSAYPNRHLHVLSHIAGCLDRDDFEERWREAEGERALKETLLHPEHYQEVQITPDGERATLIGRTLRDSDLAGSDVLLLERQDGSVLQPGPETVFEEGDWLTVADAEKSASPRTQAAHREA